MLSTGSGGKLKLEFSVPSPDAASYYEYTVRDASTKVGGPLLRVCEPLAGMLVHGFQGVALNLQSGLRGGFCCASVSWHIA